MSDQNEKYMVMTKLGLVLTAVSVLSAIIAVVLLISTARPEKRALNSDVIASELKCGDHAIYCRVSMVNLLVNANQYDDKSVVVDGYIYVFDNTGAHLSKVPEYWLSLTKGHFDIASSVEIKLSQDSPIRAWLKNGHYRVTGHFKACFTVNCRPSLARVSGAAAFINRPVLSEF